MPPATPGRASRNRTWGCGARPSGLPRNARLSGKWQRGILADLSGLIRRAVIARNHCPHCVTKNLSRSHIDEILRVQD
jgi:hypothetical protein